MRFFQSEKCFLESTGEPVKKLVFAGVRCDFCGEIIEDEGVQICIDYGSMDSCFGCGEGEYQLREKFGIDLNDLLSQPYTYHNVWTNSELSCDLTLMRQEVTEQDDCWTMEHALRTSRIRVITKLLEDEILQPSEISPQ